MSRIAKNPILVPETVTVEIRDQFVLLNGQQGSLTYSIPQEVSVTFDAQQLRVSTAVQARRAGCLAGTVRANLQNQVRGVSEGFTCILTLVGVGYRAQLDSQYLELNVGFSKSKRYLIPEGITIKLTTPTEIIIEGLDIQQVHQVAAEIIRIRPPESYQGTGIRKKGQIIKLKAAKKK
jgi:large subunit ribosomal protein L6